MWGGLFEEHIRVLKKKIPKEGSRASNRREINKPPGFLTLGHISWGGRRLKNEEFTYVFLPFVCCISSQHVLIFISRVLDVV